MTHTDSRPSCCAGLSSLPRRAADWLDSRGRYAWIAALLISFVLCWPLGILLAIYITMTNRWSNDMFKFNCCAKSGFSHRNRHMEPSGNSAFDAYRDETLRRLEEEHDAFNAFLKRLRDAKDQKEFDAFMTERAREPRTEVEPRELPQS